MTLYFITENSRTWKTQRQKCYGITIDTNSYGKTKNTNCYEISRDTFWFITSNTPLKPKASSHQALSSMIGQECIDLL